MKDIIRLGTRGSALAVRQAEIAAEEIGMHFPDVDFEIVKITTKGDKILDKTLDKIGGKGLFVKEIETALLENRIDIAVHSMKDMPDEMDRGLMIGAVTKREDPRDVLISKSGLPLSALPKGARVGTGSLRRKVQLLRLREDLEVIPIRGNVNTRIGKLAEGLDAVVLAAAGIIRSNMTEKISQSFDTEEFTPAGCQGILALQVRKDDRRIMEYIEKVNDFESQVCAEAEREFLHQIGADCHAPVGVYARLDKNRLFVHGMFYRDGFLEADVEGSAECAGKLGKEAAEKILGLEADQ